MLGFLSPQNNISIKNKTNAESERIIETKTFYNILQCYLVQFILEGHSLKYVTMGVFMR